MHFATIHIQPKGFGPIGFSQAAGMPGDIRVNFRTQSNAPYLGIASEYPQLVLMPFLTSGRTAYDIVIDDPTEATGLATIPGPIMNDRFAVEVYFRDVGGMPKRMVAAGRVDLTGDAYKQLGPLSPATYPTGPAGPMGPQGPIGPQGIPGQRGSKWFTGPGEPSLVVGLVDGDMWLNESNGDVWRWNAATGTWMAFKGN